MAKIADERSLPVAVRTGWRGAVEEEEEDGDAGDKRRMHAISNVHRGENLAG